MPGGYPWTPEELDYLRDLAGDYSLTWIHKDFNRWAARNGLRPRTKLAIHKAICEKLGQSAIPCGEWLGVMDIRKLVKRNPSTVNYWITHGFINRDYVRRDGTGFIVCRRGLRQLARDRPELLKHLSDSQLFTLLEDMDVVDHVLRSPRQPKRQAAPVRCLETGVMFPSTRAAAKSIGIDCTSLRRAIARGGTAKGLTFQEAA